MTVERDDEAVFQEISDRLLRLHRRIAALPASDEEKSTATRHLLAISDSGKQDMRRALARLDSFESDLDTGRLAAADPDEPA